MRFTYELFDENNTRRGTHLRLRFEDFAAHIRRGGFIQVTDNERASRAGFGAASEAYVDYSLNTKDQLQTFAMNNPSEVVWKGSASPALSALTSTLVEQEIKWLHEVLDVLVRCPRPQLLRLLVDIVAGRV